MNPFSETTGFFRSAPQKWRLRAACRVNTLMCLVTERECVFSCPAKFTNSDSVTNVSCDVSTFESQLLVGFLYLRSSVEQLPLRPLAQISESKHVQSWVWKVAGGMSSTPRSTDMMWHLSSGDGGVRWHLGMCVCRIGCAALSGGLRRVSSIKTCERHLFFSASATRR